MGGLNILHVEVAGSKSTWNKLWNQSSLRRWFESNLVLIGHIEQHEQHDQSQHKFVFLRVWRAKADLAIHCLLKLVPSGESEDLKSVEILKHSFIWHYNEVWKCRNYRGKKIQI